MSLKPVKTPRKIIIRAWLTLLVHRDAFLQNPVAYLKAAKWWFLRKRVRARGQLAPILGQSPRAYALWSLESAAERKHSAAGGLPPIIALVAARPVQPITPGNAAALAETTANLAAEGIAAYAIGSDVATDLAAAVSAIDWRTDAWLMPLTAGDRVAPGTADAYRAAMDDPSVQLIYADDDLIDRWDHRTDPHFKPDWNQELFQHFDYITGACIVRADPDVLLKMSGTSDWAARLVAQVARGAAVVHLRDVLHHRSVRLSPPVKAAAATVASALPPLTVIIPTRNRIDLLRTCLAGVAAADYPDVEVIVVDNDSDDPETLAFLAAQDSARVRVVHHAGVFNYSAINNRAVAQARGQLLCLLNNDVEMPQTDWLAIMATQALRDEVGAVGARLLYPDGRIQHAGVVIGVGNAAGHAHRFVRPEEDGYFRRHDLPQFASAVTAACLVVARNKFLAVGGLDEANFAVAFNDVDLCLRLNQRGWQSLYEPRATLIHHESVSRGLDHDPVGARRFAGELAALQRIWHTDRVVDPFHHPRLSRASERFALAI